MTCEIHTVPSVLLCCTILYYNVLCCTVLLQVTIWGDYGRVEGTKVFMGVAQILLDNLDLSHIVIGWYCTVLYHYVLYCTILYCTLLSTTLYCCRYKLFGTSSLVSVPPGGGKVGGRCPV